MTQQEEREFCAEALGWTYEPSEYDGMGAYTEAYWVHDGIATDDMPDFHNDESANAMLLEAMRRPLLVSDWPGCEGWRVDIGVEPMEPLPNFPNAVGGRLLGPTHRDRKTAIVRAFIAFKQKEQQHVL